MPKTYAAEFDTPIYERKIGEYISYYARTQDNPFGGQETYDMMIGKWGEGSPLARQELFGEEIITDDLRFDIWDREKMVVPRDMWPQPYPDRVVAGVDFGFTHPSAILVEGIDEEKRHYLIDDWAKTRCSEQELIEKAKDLVEKHKIKYLFCDSADPRWVKAMLHAGLPVRYAKKSLGSTGDPSSGFGLCYASMSREGKFFVSPTCKNFIFEIENLVDQYKGKPFPNEMPKNQRDDVVACWRYAEMAIEKMWGRRNDIGNASRNIEFRIGV
jgi:hypothetical protein